MSKKSKAKAPQGDTLRVIPLGGLGEIGRNMMLYEWGDDVIAVDVGLMFPEEDMVGVDLVIPEITYLMDNPTRLKAVFLTHGHEDHIGALPFLLRELNVPVFCTRLTKGLVDVKLKDHRLLKESSVTVVEPGGRVNVGPFTVEFFSVSHSIPDAAGLIIETPLGPVVHTGDFKIDHTPPMGQHTDLTRLAEVGAEGALLLAADSTYVENDGFTPSETIVGDQLERTIAKAEGRVIVTTFASLISRVQMVIDAAEQHDRRIFVTGRSMINNVQMARELGYLESKPNTFMNIKEMQNHPDAKTVIVCTGSQGEPNSALTRMAAGTHQHISIHEDDTVVLSSSPVPGNESGVHRNIDAILRIGGQVIYNRIAPVHVHGHAAREELKIVHQIVQPQHFIGIHGEYRHLVLHRQLAVEMGTDPDRAFVLTDGDVLEIGEDSAAITGQVPAEYVYVDGLGIGDVDHLVLRDRRHLANDGMVVVVVPIDRKRGKLAAPAEVMSHGFVSPDDAAPLHDGVREVVGKLIGTDAQSLDWTGIRDSLKDEIANYLYHQTHRRPLVLPVTVEV